MGASLSNQSLVPRLWFSALFTFPLAFKGFDTYVAAFFCSLVIGVGAYPFFQEVRRDKKSPLLLICLSITLLYTYSLFQLFLGAKKPLYFFETAAVITSTLFGTRLLSQATETIPTPKLTTARKLLSGGKAEQVTINALQVGDRIQVEAGELVALDGMVIAGSAVVEEFGVSVQKGFSQKVWAGTKLLQGSLVIQANEVGKDTLMDQAAMVTSHELSVATTTFFPLILTLSLFCFIFWSLINSVSIAILYTSSLLLITSPRIFESAQSLAIEQAVSTALKRGIVIKDGAIFQQYNPKVSVSEWKGEPLLTIKSKVILLSSKVKPHFSSFYKQACHIQSQNQFFAYAYSAAAMLLAILGYLSPVAAVLLMFVATLVISLNSSRNKKIYCH